MKVGAGDAIFAWYGTLPEPGSLTGEGDRKAAMVPYQPFYRDYTEWLDRKGEQVRGAGFEELFDAAIRHRFGALISRAKLESTHAPPPARRRSRRR